MKTKTTTTTNAGKFFVFFLKKKPIRRWEVWTYLWGLFLLCYLFYVYNTSITECFCWLALWESEKVLKTRICSECNKYAKLYGQRGKMAKKLNRLVILVNLITIWIIRQ